MKGYNAGKPVKDHKRYLPVDRRGLLLPCNVVVRQDEVGKVQVDFMDPGAVPDRVGKPDINLLADEATPRRERVRPAL
ncbi:MAG TPA: DUF302 domain-containing protein [Candidatus Competibacteraceae bacterium]|nr:DUF302 domain-containing protein [Candidatus Competibacteraceae bacterium]